MARLGRDDGRRDYITCSLLSVAVVILILGHDDGIYFLVPALIAVLVGGTVNAWVILTGLTH